ncbi:hypothetical protein WKK05_10195 [Nostoc sp. UHCC 0302]|uniref:hypothetical protein n=1 Tax=Nostoc sp. UHCC 0302 TaxID=3134896 RepID=UPI00311C8CD7
MAAARLGVANKTCYRKAFGFAVPYSDSLTAKCLRRKSALNASDANASLDRRRTLTPK